MMRKSIFALALLILLPLTAAATSVTMSVEPWQTYDGNFGYSVIHAPTGEIQYGFSGPTQYLTGDLTGSVLTLDGGSLALNGGSIFNVQASVLDFGVGNGQLIGALGYQLVDVGGSVENGSFYFYNHDYSDGQCDANGLCSDSGVYRLWGSNWDDGSADGQKIRVNRGIDLGGQIVSAPVPEPSAALLFGLGSLVVGRRRHRRAESPS